ncbi:hydrogenase formation protein HypD [Eubacterium xylanophilum]|uniref:hydrogenase formation protein HypD n=1 Tax=Eubacterium xylanophilum TaxID=39497 RepID=UPI00047A368F|nr:hydrogenase formation protein HypD [Eubacterium xylanophilum]
MEISDIVEKLRNYDGPEIRLMEICGSHTAAIAKYGIRSILSDKIKLISGPGCPVCVTPSSYVDRLIEIASKEGNKVASFGDLLRVPGSRSTLREAQGQGAGVEMVYSPLDVIGLAEKEPETCFTFAAIGFETTAPVFALLMDEITKKNIKNIRLLTAIKTMPRVIEWLIDNGAKIDGFIAPGHVCAVTGSEIFEPIAKKHEIPFAVSGFSDKELVIAIYGLLEMVKEKNYSVNNYYTSVVEHGKNAIADQMINKYFEPCDAVWRGMGCVQGSGLVLRDEYREYDMGSLELVEDNKMNAHCKCGEILMGLLESGDCPLFGKACTPQNPQGACMVSLEGSCYHKYLSGE